MAQQTLDECINRYVSDTMSKLDPTLSAEEKRMEVNMATSMAKPICESKMKEQQEEPARLAATCPSVKKSYKGELAAIKAKGLSQAVSRADIKAWIEKLNDDLRSYCGEEEAETLIQEGQKDGEKIMQQKEKSKGGELKKKTKKKESGKKQKKGKAKARTMKPRILEMK